MNAPYTSEMEAVFGNSSIAQSRGVLTVEDAFTANDKTNPSPMLQHLNAVWGDYVNRNLDR